MRARLLAPVVLVCSALCLAACGGDKGDDAPPPGAAGSQPAGSTAGTDDSAMGMGGLPSGHPPMGGMGSPGPLRPGMGMEQPEQLESSFAWTLPEGWTEHPGSYRMRLAELDAGLTGGHDGRPAPRCVVYGGITGGVDANLARWISEFKQADGSASKDKAEVSKSEAGGVTIHRIELTGTYKQANMMGGESAESVAESMLLGAVVEADHGTIFLKFVGPKKDLTAVEAAFDELLVSVKSR